MATLDERFQKGLEIRQHLGGGEGRFFQGSVASAYELAPDMHRITTESLYGSLWSRPGLSLKHRVMATLTACAAQLAVTQVREYIRTALDVGITPEEIVEICMMLAFYSGIPGSYNTLALAQEVFQERRIAFTPPTLYDPTVDPQTLYDRGLAQHRELIPDVFGYHPLQPTPEEYDLDALRQEYCWGAVWSRPGLDMKSRIVCALSALLVLGQYSISTRRMIEGALRYGFTPNEILEIGLHLTFYVGLVPARIFINVAGSVLRSPEFAPGDDDEQAS